MTQPELPLPSDHSIPSYIDSDLMPPPSFSSGLGHLFQGDCLDLFRGVADQSVDTVFADPPFNLGKIYGKASNDSKSEAEYLRWSKQWLDESMRCLKPGGALFVYNIPRWNMPLGAYLSENGMNFRHWVAINIKASLPISGRLYPSHYSLLYFTKGKPKSFTKIRTPIEVCRHCGKELKDYGGHRNAMNPKGVNLTDVWNDISPVRHWKFKSKNRKANQLSTKIVQRALNISTIPGDVVLDPFGGSGTTFAVSETMHRRWIGFELENTDVIIERLSDSEIQLHPSNDFIDD